jgi:hypothetical protein
MADKRNVQTATTRDDRDENRDPITGAPGSHPVSAGLGAAAAGAVGGPAAP